MFCQGLGGVQFEIQQNGEGVMDFKNRFWRESPPLQANGIQPVSARVARAYGFGKRKHVFGHNGSAANISVCAYAAKLMYGAECSNHRPFAHSYVSGKRGGVDQHRVIAYRTIVAHVRVRQKKYVTAQRGQAAALGGPAVYGD